MVSSILKGLISEFLLSAVPVPLVNLLEADVEAISQVLHILGGPVGVLLEARLEELLLIVRQTMSWQPALLTGFVFVMRA